MKLVALIFTLFLNTYAFAGNLYYSNGPAKGSDVAKVYAYVGINDICFVDNGVVAKTSLYYLLSNDIEKTAAFTAFDKTKDTIIYGYVDTNCTDDGGNDVNCRSMKTAKRCL